MKVFPGKLTLPCLLIVASAAGSQSVAANAQSAAAGSGDRYRLAVTYDRPGLVVPHWEVVIPVSGAAEYTGKPEKSDGPGSLSFPLSDAGRARLGGLLVRSKGLQPCETKTKNLANMGMKSVTYMPAAGAEAKCSFNYTDNKPLADVLDYTMAIVATLQAGMELDRLHRYDRLGLDAVMARLAEDAKNGRAVELGAIRPTLDSLVADVALMDRVRTRAQQLSDLAKQQDNVASSR